MIPSVSQTCGVFCPRGQCHLRLAQPVDDLLRTVTLPRHDVALLFKAQIDETLLDNRARFRRQGQDELPECNISMGTYIGHVIFERVLIEELAWKDQ